MLVQEVGIHGEAQGVEFTGGLILRGQSVVLTGNNGQGKTTAGKAIAWCLGLEPLFDVSRSDVSIFPEACRSRVLLHGRLLPVDSCYATLLIAKPDGEEALLRRAIVGGDANLVRVDVGGVSRILRLSGPSMQDEVGGFFGWLFSWLDLPVAPLRTRQGKSSRLYLENLGPMLYVEQLRGWTDLFATQVRKYGLLEVDAAAVEYLLGLRTAIQRRFAEQSVGAMEAELRASGAHLVHETNRLLRQATSDHADVLPVRTKRIAKLLGTGTVLGRIEEAWGETIEVRRRALEENRARIASGFAAATEEQVESSAARRRVVADLYETRRVLREQSAAVDTLYIQHEAHATLAREISDESKATRDLARLKEEGIGFPQVSTCPTCEQPIRMSDFQVQRQSLEQVQGREQTLAAEREALRLSLRAIQSDIKNAKARMAKARLREKELQREIRAIDATLSPDAEAQARRAQQLVAVERRMSELEGIAQAAASLQEEIAGWLAQYAAVQAEDNESPEEEVVVRQFLDRFRSSCRSLGHSALADEPGQVEFDDNYVPFLAGRKLGSLGSASDRARLVLAYTWSLAHVAVESSGLHPGLLVLDEPLQQNPDPGHRAALVKFLCEEWGQQPCQTLLLTNLTADEQIQLETAGVQVLDLHERLLNPVSAIG